MEYLNFLLYDLKFCRMCNCDSGEDAVDDGYNRYPQLLPVMNLYLGGTTQKSSINVTIGSLTCSHRSKRILKMFYFSSRFPARDLKPDR